MEFHILQYNLFILPSLIKCEYCQDVVTLVWNRNLHMWICVGKPAPVFVLLEISFFYSFLNSRFHLPLTLSLINWISSTNSDYLNFSHKLFECLTCFFNLNCHKMESLTCTLSTCSLPWFGPFFSGWSGIHEKLNTWNNVEKWEPCSTYNCCNLSAPVRQESNMNWPWFWMRF